MPRADRQLPDRTPEHAAILRAFGQRVAELRVATIDEGRTPTREGKEWPFSQDRFALHVGLHRTVMSEVERGLINPTLITIHKIAAGLGVTVSELTDGIEDEAQ